MLGEYDTPDWRRRRWCDAPSIARSSSACSTPAAARAPSVPRDPHFPRRGRGGRDARERRAAEACVHIAGTDIHPVAIIIARVTYLLALAPALAHRSGAFRSRSISATRCSSRSPSSWPGRITIRVPPPPLRGRDGAETATAASSSLSRRPSAATRRCSTRRSSGMRTGSSKGSTRAQIEAALHRITEQHYRTDVTAEQNFGDRRIWARHTRLRPAAARQARHDLGLCGAQPIAPARLFGGRRLGQRGDRQPALARLPPHEPEPCKSGSANWRKTSGYTSAAGLRRKTTSARCSWWGGAPLFALRRPDRLHPPFGGTDPWPLRAPANGLVSLGQDRLGRGLDHGRTGPAAIPVPSCTVFGRKQAAARRIPATVRAYSAGPRFGTPGRGCRKQARSDRGCGCAHCRRFAGGSVSAADAFRQGATLVPRMLCLVERRQMGRLGANPECPDGG